MATPRSSNRCRRVWAKSAAWGVSLQSEPGLRLPNMFEAALDGSFKGMYIQGEDLAQSDPNTSHVTAALSALECLVIQDIFHNETAKYAHVFLPGTSFLEKDGTFTNAERRISPVRKVMPPLAGKEDWEVTVALSNALGYPMDYKHPSEIMDEIARLTPTFTGVSYQRLDELGSIQWPCNEAAPEGTPIMPGQTRTLPFAPRAEANQKPPVYTLPVKSEGQLDWELGSFKVDVEFK